MGSGQSARTLTVTNEEEIGVIKVSNSLVQRIAERAKSQASESSASAEPTTPSEHSASPFAATTVSSAAANATGQPMYYHPELTISAHQIYQQKEQELKQQEQYWHRRLQNVDESYQKINHILAEEYQKTIAETSVKGQNIIDIQGTGQPCLENSNKVLKCFQSHPKEILACSSLVQEFSNCVWNVHYTHAIETRS